MTKHANEAELNNLLGTLEHARLQVVEKIIASYAAFTDADLAKFVLYGQAIASLRDAIEFSRASAGVTEKRDK